MLLCLLNNEFFLAVIVIFVISSLFVFFAQETIDSLLLNLMLIMG